MKKKKISTYDLVVVGVMAALIFAATSFLKIGPIPTPAGPCMIKTANVLCLLGGMLFGGWRGGLAAGIGSMLFDLSDPIFAPSAPFTLVNFFMMALVCGLIAHWQGKKGAGFWRNAIAAACGSLTYLVLYIGKSLLSLMLAGSDFQAALAACSIKLVTSGINMVFAIAVSVMIAPVCRKALVRAGLSARLFPQKAA